MTEWFEEETPLNSITQDLYAALEDNSVNRRWKKKAVDLLVVISELQKELKQEDSDVPELEVQKTIRQAEDLLNQLNRY